MGHDFAGARCEITKGWPKVSYDVGQGTQSMRIWCYARFSGLESRIYHQNT